MYLDELQDMLRETHGVTVSPPTIWRALRSSGFTMKKVCVVFVMACNIHK